MVKTTESVVMTKTSSKNHTYSVSTGNAAHCPDTNGTWRSTTTGENNLSRNCTSKECHHNLKNHTLPKGSVNHMSLWKDMCEEHRRYFLYRLGLAGGITSSECATHIFPSKN